MVWDGVVVLVDDLDVDGLNSDSELVSESELSESEI